jgi:hypothetical protein
VPWKLQTAKQIHFHQMSEEQLLRVFAEGVRTRDLKTAAAAADQLRKRFPSTEIPYRVIVPEMDEERPHHGVVNAAINTWHKDTVLAALERAAMSSGRGADRGHWQFAANVAGNAVAKRLRPPRWVVSKLLAHPMWSARMAGLTLVQNGAETDTAALLALLEDDNSSMRVGALRALVSLARTHSVAVPESKLRDLALRDTNVNVRVQALHAMSGLAHDGRMPFPARLMIDRTEKGEPQERATAIRSLAWHLHSGTELPREQVMARVLDAAREDPDQQVREAAIDNLENMGAAGADVAIELLGTPGFLASDSVESAIWAAVVGGRAAELLEQRTSPEVAMLALNDVRDLDDEEHPNVLRDLTHAIGPVLAWKEIYATDDAEDSVSNLMHTLVERNLPELVIQVATDEEAPVYVRGQALYGLLSRRETHASGFALAAQVLRDSSSPAELRINVVESLGDFWHEDDFSVNRAAVRAEFDRAAEHDPSFYVREAAKQQIENVDD